MINTFTTPQNIDIIPTQNERSERLILQEQLRHWRNIDKQTRNVIAQLEKRLAEIEAAQVKRETAA